MIFPRETIKVGDCIAVVCQQNRLSMRSGSPMIKDAYPQFIYEGEPWKAHRLSYCLNIEKIPRRPANRKEGLVLHTCDNKWCISPEHLYLGTQLQNMKDVAERKPERREKVIRSGRQSANRMKKWWAENPDHRKKIVAANKARARK